MDDARIPQIIEDLEWIRDRRILFMGTNSASAATTFLQGFQSACIVLGLPVSFDVRKLAIEERGWASSAGTYPVLEMGERGLSDDAIGDEIFEIEIASWRRLAEAGAA